MQRCIRPRPRIEAPAGIELKLALFVDVETNDASYDVIDASNADNTLEILHSRTDTGLAKQLNARVKVSSDNPGTNVSVAHTYIPVLVGQTAALGDLAV
jgi:hypothetical protein